MNKGFLQVLLVLSCTVYGLGATRLMYWILDVVLSRLPAKALLANILTVLTWFVGGGAVMLGVLRFTDLGHVLGIREADGVSILCYILGFGTGLLLIERWSKPSFIRDLKKGLTDLEVEAVLLMLRYGVGAEEAARVLQIPREEMEEAFKSALKKLNARGKQIITAIGQNSSAKR